MKNQKFVLVAAAAVTGGQNAKRPAARSDGGSYMRSFRFGVPGGF